MSQRRGPGTSCEEGVAYEPHCHDVRDDYVVGRGVALVEEGLGKETRRDIEHFSHRYISTDLQSGPHTYT